MMKYISIIASAFALGSLGACGSTDSEQKPNGGDPNPCPSQIWSAGDTTVQLTVDGLDRQYILHVPPTYTGAERVPLVVDMHGFGAGGTRQETRRGGWREKAEGEGFERC